MYNKIFNVTRVKMSSWYKTCRNPYTRYFADFISYHKNLHLKIDALVHWYWWNFKIEHDLN